MKKTIFVGLLGLYLTGCIWDTEYELNNKQKIIKDFWLTWWYNEDDQNILCSQSNGQGGTLIIDHTVFAVGYNDSFIIAKQHPDKQSEIKERLFNRDSTEGTYLLSNPADTIWLINDDSIYSKKGKWYHISNGWNPPDSLKPYKSITNFYIIDIKLYDSKKPDSYKVYEFDNEKNFVNKRQQLGVPKDLNFTIVNKALE